MNITRHPATHGVSTVRSRGRRDVAALVALCATFAAAHATTVTDPANDFLPTFTGAHSPDLDVLSAFATYDGLTFHLGATLNGAVGTLPSSLYVFGIDRGRGSTTSNFAAIGAPGVIFDAVITMTGAGVLGGRDLVSNTALTLPAGAAHISGSTFSIDVPASLLPTEGFAPGSFAVNLWPRDASVAAGNGQISDFAPNNSDFVVSAAPVPEPETVLLMAAGLAGLAAVVRRRKKA